MGSEFSLSGVCSILFNILHTSTSFLLSDRVFFFTLRSAHTREWVMVQHLGRVLGSMGNACVPCESRGWWVFPSFC